MGLCVGLGLPANMAHTHTRGVRGRSAVCRSEGIPQLPNAFEVWVFDRQPARIGHAAWLPFGFARICSQTVCPWPPPAALAVRCSNEHLLVKCVYLQVVCICWCAPNCAKPCALFIIYVYVKWSFVQYTKHTIARMARKICVEKICAAARLETCVNHVTYSWWKCAIFAVLYWLWRMCWPKSTWKTSSNH